MPSCPAAKWWLVSEMGAIHIQTADSSMSAALANFHAEVWPRPWTVPDFADFIESQTAMVLVAQDNGNLVGFCVIQSVADDAEVLMIATSPAHQRQGIGRALLAEAFSGLGQRGATACFLEVSVENQAAIGLYQSFGFGDVGRRKAYYQPADQTSAPVDALVMRLALPTSDQ
jgi:[ribosomal protein S18]-alanine N-acetyltransferase